jgi:hypothetical protein
MNYKTLFTAIFINYFVVLNVWAGCCFLDGSGLSECVEQYNGDQCQNESGVAFITGFAHCLGDSVTCCAGPQSWPEFIYKGNVISVDPDVCDHPDVLAAVRLELPRDESFNCCSYTRANGSSFCDASLGSYTFEECKKLAKNAGAKKFKWGQVDEAAARVCWTGGTCGDVQEYLKVTLDNLIASTLGKQLFIKWDTAFEENNLGMNLWCTQMQGNQFKEITKLNSELIPSKAILPNYGAVYSSTDYPYVNTNLKPGIQHCTLEDIDASGQCTLHCDQIDTVIIGEGNKLADTELNQLQAKAIALCNEHKQNGVCLDQLLAPNQ